MTTTTMTTLTLTKEELARIRDCVLQEAIDVEETKEFLSPEGQTKAQEDLTLLLRLEQTMTNILSII